MSKNYWTFKLSWIKTGLWFAAPAVPGAVIINSLIGAPDIFTRIADRLFWMMSVPLSFIIGAFVGRKLLQFKSSWPGLLSVPIVAILTEAAWLICAKLGEIVEKVVQVFQGHQPNNEPVEGLALLIVFGAFAIYAIFALLVGIVLTCNILLAGDKNLVADNHSSVS